MEWVKLYTRLPRDPAIRAAVSRCPSARDLFCLGLLYVGEQETDGFIPPFEPPTWQINRWKAAAEALVAEGLWVPFPAGGWTVRRWLDRNASKEKAEAARRAGADRQSRYRDRHSNGVTAGVSDATRVEESRSTPLPPASGGHRSACQRHRARPKAGCPDCARPAPTLPAATPLSDLCDMHGRDKSTCPFCLPLPLEVGQ